MFVYKSESEFCYIHGAIKNCILSAAPVIAEFWFSEHKRALFLIFSHFFFFFSHAQECVGTYVYNGYDFEMSCSRTENNFWWEANVEAVCTF